jgi:membrane glycosyltransferase
LKARIRAGLFVFAARVVSHSFANAAVAKAAITNAAVAKQLAARYSRPESPANILHSARSRKNTSSEPL